jgi:protein SCO1/2
MTKLYAGLAAAAVIAVVGGSIAWTFLRAPDDAFAQCRDSAVAGGAGAIGGPFTLVSETGTTVTETDVITKPSLVYFGYTYCPDICPFDAARNADAVDLLAGRGYDVQPVFISVDPERDTPERLAEFTDFLHPAMIGLSGSEEQVRAASQAYKTYYRKQDSADEFYLVDHSTFTYLVLPGQGFVEFFRREATPEEMAESTACFIDAAAQIN